MKSRVRTIAQACAVIALLSTPHSRAQTPPAASEDAVPIARVIAGVAKTTGKKFLVDPRVRADVTLIGFDPDRLDYATMLSVLHVHGFAAVDDGKYVRVLPDPGARHLAIPLLTGNDSHPNAEYVSRVIAVKNVPAAQLVPILRPLLPQQAHLVAFPCTNQLILVDTYGNVKRLEKLVAAIDTGEPYKPEKCGAPQMTKAD